MGACEAFASSRAASSPTPETRRQLLTCVTLLPSRHAPSLFRHRPCPPLSSGRLPLPYVPFSFSGGEERALNPFLVAETGSFGFAQVRLLHVGRRAERCVLLLFPWHVLQALMSLPYFATQHPSSRRAWNGCLATQTSFRTSTSRSSRHTRRPHRCVTSSSTYTHVHNPALSPTQRPFSSFPLGCCLELRFDAPSSSSRMPTSAS